ncbi:hypothetical protein EJ04DRAFT_508984 [Polyplosphaeria fusca]|uniref:Anaphase-promoting complex subunit CDC26 n=1 Tax=Polyplosphaeria fusca TaxID=682080 RepID=A0A9P4R9N5_9PLEO|nr:hypothetical protein EJ04DRAFT_508984 [Polyplosphaeria fusca]
MLRRAPTTISLTAADIERYEAQRKQRLWQQQQQQQQQQSSSQSTISSESGKKVTSSDKKPREKSAKDRIMGIGRQ